MWKCMELIKKIKDGMFYGALVSMASGMISYAVFLPEIKEYEQFRRENLIAFQGAGEFGLRGMLKREIRCLSAYLDRNLDKRQVESSDAQEQRFKFSSNVYHI
jgi:hypothetical protein